MKKKMIYVAPEAEQMEVHAEDNFLASVEGMNTINGTWDEE